MLQTAMEVDEMMQDHDYLEKALPPVNG